MAPCTGRFAEPAVEDCQEPIAVVGMGCRWPGDIDTPSELWDFLINKKSGHSERVPPSRFDIDAHYHPNLHRPGSFNVLGGYFLSGDLRDFDPSMFGISPVEAMWLDPQQRKLLEVVYECLESSGVTMEQISGTQTGCFVGTFTNDFQQMSTKEADFRHSYAATGVDPGLISNRVSHVFNLSGPSFTINTACSSSVYALHQACNALRAGDCTASIVGGTNLILTVDQHINTAKLGVLSPTSRCHTFNAHANGYGRGEGVGALYLKRLSDALRDGDTIRAVIRGSAVNSNGKVIGAGITHPSLEGQIAVIKEAYRLSGGLNPLLTGYFECHGTGTAVGDPLEVEALSRVMSPGRSIPLIIGAVKASIGHCEAASGIAAVMKAVLAVEKGIIPATYGFTNPNPNIKWDEWNVTVNAEAVPWPKELPIRRASVNSFGYGGTNAHIIIEAVDSVVPGYGVSRRKGMKRSTLARRGKHASPSLLVSPADTIDEGYKSGRDVAHDHVLDNVAAARYASNSGADGQVDSEPDLTDSEEHTAAAPHTLPSRRKQFLLPFSAHEPETLRKNIARLAAVAAQYDLKDLAYTLSGRRSHQDKRAFAVTTSSTLAADLDVDSLIFGDAKDALPAKAAFVFTGQGAQWPRMGSTLITEFPSFRQTIQSLDAVLGRLTDAPPWTLEGALMAQPKESRVNEVALSQPLCTAIQVSLLTLLESWGITPVATVGHSSGEIAAAYGAGFISASEAIIIAFYRGKVVSENKKQGAMLAVGLGAKEVGKYLIGLEGQVVIACHNSSASVTLSGDSVGISLVSQRLEEDGIFNRKLMTDGRAYHSHHMKPCAAMYEGLVETALKRLGITRSSKIRKARMISSVTGKELNEIDSGYWSRNLTGSVLFDSALAELVRQDTEITHILELGPHGALGGPIRQILKDCVVNITYEPTLSRNADGVECLLQLAGKLYLKNFPVNLVSVNSIEHEAGDVTVRRHGNFIPDLPRYQWTYKKLFWAENRPSVEVRTKNRARHDVLGRKVFGVTDIEPVWRNIVRNKDLPWLKDHQIGPDIIFPGAGHWAMAVEAVTQLYEESFEDGEIRGFKLRDLSIKTALVIPDNDDGVEVVLNMRKASSEKHTQWYSFSVKSVENGNWKEHSSGVIAVIKANFSTRKDSPSLPLRHCSTGRQWYKAFRGVGFNYGPNFQGLDEIRTDPSCMEAVAKIPIKRESGTMLGESRYALHPSTIDNCLQLALISIYSGRFGNITSGFVPVKADEITICVPLDRELAQGNTSTVTGNAFARTTTKGIRSAQCSVQLTKGDTNLLKISGLRVIAYEAAIPHSLQDVGAEPYWQSRWVPDFDSTAIQPSNVSSLDSLTQLQKFNKLADMIMVRQPENKVLEILPTRNDASHETAYRLPLNCRAVLGCETDVDAELLVDRPNEPDSKAEEFVLLDDLVEGDAKFDLILCQNEPSPATMNKIPELLSNKGSVLLMSKGVFPQTDLTSYGLFTRLHFSDSNSSLLLLSKMAEKQQDIETNNSKEEEILIVHYEANFEAIKALESTAKANGRPTRVIHLEEYAEPAANDVILILDQRRPFFANINATLLTQLKSVLRTAGSIIWLTSGSLSGSSRPEGAMALGFRRSLAAEQPSLKLKVIDINTFNVLNLNTVLSQFTTPSLDNELMVEDGIVHVNRLVPHRPANEQSQKSKSNQAESIEFTGQRLIGMLSGGAHPSVEFEVDKSSTKPAPGHVEVSIRASGINTEDSQVLNGSVDHVDIRREFSGIVTNVASDVVDLQIGDAVCGICNDSLSTFQTVPSSICQKITANTQDDFERYASVPTAYTTAYHAIMNVARIEAAERIVITGDTGFAGKVAIRLAQSANAQIFVTAKSLDEVEKLKLEFSLAETQIIYNQGQELQEEDIFSLTESSGFDIVFTGGSENLQDFWRTIAPGGRLIHLGSTSISQFDSAPFARGASFSCIDIRTLFKHKLKLLSSIWKEAYQLCSQLKFIENPLKVFPLDKAIEAVNSSSNRLVGEKRVISYRVGDMVPVRPDKNQPIFNENATYLLVGCLGGLGRSLSSWMIERGARHLVFLSRTGDDKPEAAKLIEDIQSQGVTAQVIRGDAAVRQDVERARYSVPSSRPIRGIVQAATVFEDALFETLQVDGLKRSLHAKVNGTKNLHKVFLNHHLDFFVMTSSISATLGTPGQTNYAAGNSYLDYLARYRISRGLPATSLILPMVLGVGYVSQRPEVEDGLLRKGLYGIDEDEVLEAFELAITGFPGEYPEIIVGMDPSRLSKALREGTTSDPFWFNDSRLCGIKAAITIGNSSNAGQGAASHGKIVDRLRQDFGPSAKSELLEAAAGHIKDKISRMMLIPLEEISSTRSVQYYGVDSSIGTELRSWLFNEFNVDLSIQTMLEPTMSLAGLAEHLCVRNGLVEEK